MRTRGVIGLLLAVIAALSAALVTVVAVDNSRSAPAPVAAAPAAAVVHAPAGAEGAVAQLTAAAGGPMRLLQRLSTEIGVPAGRILADLKAGQSLDQIAGSKAQKLHDDLLAMARTQLDKAVAKGAISSSDESRLLSDASDAVSVLMSAKLGLLYSGR